jgi:hypothetical protein
MADQIRTERLRNEIEHVASQIDDELLALASPEAREEWRSARSMWRGGLGAPRLVEDELAVVLGKVRRFGDILRDMRGRMSLETWHET